MHYVEDLYDAQKLIANLVAPVSSQDAFPV